jgi:hypothetical protein
MSETAHFYNLGGGERPATLSTGQLRLEFAQLSSAPCRSDNPRDYLAILTRGRSDRYRVRVRLAAKTLRAAPVVCLPLPTARAPVHG